MLSGLIKIQDHESRERHSCYQQTLCSLHIHSHTLRDEHNTRSLPPQPPMPPPSSSFLKPHSFLHISILVDGNFNLPIAQENHRIHLCMPSFFSLYLFHQEFLLVSPTAYSSVIALYHLCCFHPVVRLHHIFPRIFQ